MSSTFTSLPLWAVFLLTIALVLVSIFVGFALGRRRARTRAKGDEPIGAAVGATLGLLAFMLAFTFGMTSSRFETRKQLVLDEANAIGTGFLRAEMLPEPERTTVRDLFRQYVNARLEWVGHLDLLSDAIARSRELQNRLWSQAVSAAAKEPESDIVALFVESINDVIDLHSNRVNVGLRYHVPESIWVALYFLTVISMAAVGYQFGVSGAGSVLFSLFLALGFSTVILLISDLDRVGEGLIRVSQDAMVELQQNLEATAD